MFQCILYSLVLIILPRDAYALGVRASVTFVDHVKTNKDIFDIFSPSGGQAILVFPYQMGWRCSDGKLGKKGNETKK